MAEILRVDSKKKCYLLHDDLLAVGVPFSKLNSAVVALKDGKADSKALWTKHIFTLSDDFRMEHDPKTGLLTLSQGQRVHIEDAPEMDEIYTWLSRNLKKRRFFPVNVPISNPRKLVRGIIAAAVVLVIAISLFLLQSSGLLNFIAEQIPAAKIVLSFLSAANIIGAALVLIGLIMAWSLLAFIKSRSQLEVFELGYRPQTVNGR